MSGKSRKKTKAEPGTADGGGSGARAILFTLFVLIIFFALSAASPLSAQEYRLGEGDLLDIEVYGHDDLNIEARVGADGTIEFPFIGSVEVEGLTSGEVAARITELLAGDYIIDPHVIVGIKEYRSNKAVILGQVENPGLYVLEGPTTLLEFLSKAGGLTKQAGQKAIIKRKLPEGGNEVITIDLHRLIEEGDTTQDIQLEAGDNIFIAKSGVFFITGEVNDPDEYIYQEGITVIKAVTRAGGFTDKASSSRIRIIRKIKGEEMLIEGVSLDEPIRPDDVIIVPESYF